MVTIINDMGGNDVPFVETKIKNMSAEVKGWSSSVCSIFGIPVF